MIELRYEPEEPGCGSRLFTLWLFRKSLLKNNDSGHIRIFQRLKLFIPVSSSKPIFQRRKQKGCGSLNNHLSLRNARMPTVACLASESCCFSTMTVLPWVTHGPRGHLLSDFVSMAPVGYRMGQWPRVSPGLASRPCEHPPAPSSLAASHSISGRLAKSELGLESC